jgi:hypothetical protein
LETRLVVAAMKHSYSDTPPARPLGWLWFWFPTHAKNGLGVVLLKY